MTLEQYRRSCGWSISELARQAGIDPNTARKALKGEPISPRTAQTIASAISQAMGSTVRVTDIEGLNVSF